MKKILTFIAMLSPCVAMALSVGFIIHLHQNSEISAKSYRDIAYICEYNEKIKPLFNEAIKDGKITVEEYYNIQDYHRNIDLEIAKEEVKERINRK